MSLINEKHKAYPHEKKYKVNRKAKNTDCHKMRESKKEHGEKRRGLRMSPRYVSVDSQCLVHPRRQVPSGNRQLSTLFFIVGREATK